MEMFQPDRRAKNAVTKNYVDHLKKLLKKQ